ncbi:MAG TPA: TlpA disulfide reductase family protein, partial [Candidatus Cloacimonadota bacterium]|nr:TlpA disulfide reductase family protein [Candidatus Cloacimonadota bacterium]
MKRLVLLMALTILMVTLSAADLMPDFRLSDMDGNNVSLESLLGKGPILIDFWADFCAPCKTAMPYLNDLAQKYEDLTVVMISIDAPKTQ